MSEDTQELASDSSVDENLPSTEDQGDQSPSESVDDRFEQQQANYDLLSGNFEELKETIFEGFKQLQRPPATVEEPVDEEEGLTESKVERIIKRSLQAHGDVQNNNNQRAVWDQKAKDEFPLHDPKFLKEFKREWKEQIAGGLMQTHPRALYNVAKMTARLVGLNKRKTEAKVEEEPLDTGEPPAPRRTVKESSGKFVLSKDEKVRQQVSFYNMRGDRTPKQLAAFQQDLEDKRTARRA